MNIKLISHTENPEKVVAAAAKLCYSKSEIGTLMDNLTDEKVCEFLDRLSNRGHCYDGETEVLTKDVGSILVGKEAVKEGIIDAVGGISDAFARLYHLIEKYKS